MEQLISPAFYRGKRVFVTGHTGFKGAWMSRMLLNLGVEVTGFALDPPTEPNLFALLGLTGRMRSVTGDVRNLAALCAAMDAARPDIVIHMAAQPIVRESYRDPVGTYEVNVMGTVNLLEAVHRCDSVRSLINVTTDKVYQNNEWPWGYREADALDGYDPYSNSKSCSELVTATYRRSFFAGRAIAISTMRAGNVIGGGDFAADRILPDCLRALEAGRSIAVRNPNSIRPYQHVLEAVSAYLMLAWRQWEEPALAGCYNVGPDDGDCVTTGQLLGIFCRHWGPGAAWVSQEEVGAPHEAGLLKLDCAKLKKALGWRPRWTVDDAVARTVAWDRAYLAGEDTAPVVDRQITEYLEL